MVEHPEKRPPLAPKLHSDLIFGGTSHEEVTKRVGNSLAVQLDDDRRPEHNNARSGWSPCSIKARQGAAAETAAEEAPKARKETGHSTAEPGNAACAIAQPSHLGDLDIAGLVDTHWSTG
jgi:hypothetical protein